MSEISKGNPLDKNQSGKVKIKTTNFPMHYHVYGTYRFGENGVIGVFNGLAKDRTKIRQIINLNTYTLKAPLLTPITMNRTYIQVPRMAVLPNAWDKLFVNPKIGNDIDSTQYGTSVEAEYFESFLRTITNNLKTALLSHIDTQNNTYTGSASEQKIDFANIVKALVLTELIYSNGNLMSAMGAHVATLWENIHFDKITFDTYFERFWSTYLYQAEIGAFSFTKDNKDYKVIININTTEKSPNFTKLTLNQFLEILRDGDDITIQDFFNLNNQSATPNAGKWYTCMYSRMYGNLKSTTSIQFNRPFDTMPLWAYQLSCAEFFTKDNVDYIYNAELFRQYIGNLIQSAMTNNGDDLQSFAYNYNGQKILPDWLSARFFDYMVNEIGVTDVNTRAYIFALFKYNRSLKYNDYFTGARTRPIAIGDTDINVTADDTVEVIDVVRNIQKQRFLNVVNKIPRDLKGYTKGIFGKDVAPDWHNPLFLITISESIYGEETENTGEAQLTEKQTRTSTLKNQANRLEVNFNLDRNSVIVGIVNFDIPRAYSKGIKRYFFDVDRFDWFNPYMQYTGDQEIYQEEIDCRNTGTFGYTGAYMDKKQEVNEAFGGFIEDLKGWTFLDRYIGPENDAESDIKIGPDFIRSKPSELDRFYVSLSGHSMANYFHFIMDIETHTNANRAMAYNPQILA